MTDDKLPTVIGVDIGGTKIMAGQVTQTGHIVRHVQTPTPSKPTDIINAVRDLCETFIASDQTIAAIGIGTAGMVNTASGQVIHANENLAGWTGVNLSHAIKELFVPIFVENDVRAMAYAEAVLGSGQDYSNLLVVTIGTGIGGALILDGDIWHGTAYSAGEIGYLVVDWNEEDPIIFDHFASGPAIEKSYQLATDNDVSVSLRDIAKKAYGGDDVARQVIKTKARQFGVILGGYVTSINPQCVVLGGGVPQIGLLWWDTMKTAFYNTVPSPLQETQLIPSSLGVEAVMIGAAMLAWKKV